MEIMKKYFIAVAALTAALTFSVKAGTITDLGQFTLSNQNPVTVLAGANAHGVDSGVLPDDQDLQFGGRITGSTGGSFTNSFGTFSVTVDASNHAFLTFTMNPGAVLAGIGVHAGGGHLERFFSINDETSGTVEGPFFGNIKKGKAQGLSNFDIFVEGSGAPHVPDGGSTVGLLGLALGSLAAVRAKFQKH